MSEPYTSDQEQQVYDALFSGNKIIAIKLHREFTGEGLKESKDFIEALERDLRRESPGRFSHLGNRRGCIGVLVLAIGIAVVMLA